MTAVGLGQQSSQAVGSGFESLSCQLLLRFISMPEISETLRGSFTKFFGNLSQKFLTENCDTPPLPPLFSKKIFVTKNFVKHRMFPYEFFRHCETKIFQRKTVIPFCIKYRNHWVELMFVRTLKTKFKTVVFLTLCKI